MTMKCNRIVLVAMMFVFACLGSAQAAMRVGIRDAYLKGLGADTAWEAAKAVTTPFLEVVVNEKLICERLFEGDKTPYRVDTPEHRSELLKAAEKNGCEIIAFCSVVAFEKDKTDDASAAYIKQVAEAAREMKVPVVMMPFGGRQIEQDEFVRRSVAFVKAIAPVARATGVKLTIENLGPYLNKREVLEPIARAAVDDEVGLALDITNMYWFGHPVGKIYQLAGIFAPHVRYAHAKNIKYPQDKRNRQRTPGWEYRKYAEPIRTGDIDFDRIIGTLVAAGFQGDIVIEDDSLHKFDAAGKRKVLKDDAALLREIIAKKSPKATPTVQAETQHPRVRFETTLGEFAVELYADKTPETCKNFLRYVDEGFYRGTVFHRIISNFMIQGGGFVSLSEQKTAGLHEPIRNEAKQGVKNRRGTIAMARTRAPHSATAQFFINVKDNSFLDYPGGDGWGYCAFGKVVEGMDIVDKIKDLPTQANPANPNERSLPVEAPVIRNVLRVN